MKHSALWSALAMVASAANAQTQVWTVDDDAGADFAQIQPAVDAAASGDLILLRDGVYLNFEVVGKGVSIVGEPGALVTVKGSVTSSMTRIAMLPAGERVRLRGFVIEPPGTVPETLLQVEDCAGQVWLEELDIGPNDANPFTVLLDSKQSVLFDDCDEVIVVNSTIVGANGTISGIGVVSGASALRTFDSTTYAFGTLFAAGESVLFEGDGVEAARIAGGLFVARDSTFIGGTGGPGNLIFQPGIPGDGGPGVTLTEDVAFWSIGTQLVGGDAGPGALPNSFGQPGPPIEQVLFTGTVVEDTADAARLTTSSLVRDDAVVNDKVLFDLESVPNSFVFMLLRLEPSVLFVPAWPDVLGVGLDALILPFGTTDATGKWSFALDVPTLPAGLATWSSAVQMAVIDGVPDLELSNPSIFTVVDDIY